MTWTWSRGEVLPDYWPTNLDPEVKKRRFVELDIAIRTIDAILDAGYLIAVSDDRTDADNSVVQEKTSDRTAIIKSLFTSDDNVLFVYNKFTEKCCGWVLLLYGNSGWDLLADWTMVVVDQLLKPVNDYIEATWE